MDNRLFCGWSVERIVITGVTGVDGSVGCMRARRMGPVERGVNDVGRWRTVADAAAAAFRAGVKGVAEIKADFIVVCTTNV